MVKESGTRIKAKVYGEEERVLWGEVSAAEMRGKEHTCPGTTALENSLLS